MKELYNVELVDIGSNRAKLNIKFGKDSAYNSEIVPYVVKLLDAIEWRGGKLLLVNGPASLPVAFAIAHKVNHLFGAIAVWDPKQPLEGTDIVGSYVVAISHSPDYLEGTTLTEEPIIV